MAYITGSLTDANPGPALYALMAPALTTAGFTLVDTVTVSTRTHKVWKSAAANNAQGLDWYLDIGYQTAGVGTITLQPFEHFDPATDLGYRGPFTGVSNSTIDAATSSRFGATGYALETNWIGGTGFSSYATALIATAFGYWISVTPERIAMLLSNDPTKVAYAGFYQPDTRYAAKAGAGLYPLLGARLTAGTVATSTTTTTATAAVTRIPPLTSIAGGSGWGAHITMAGLSTVEFSSYPQIPAGPVTAYPLVALPIELLVSTDGVMRLRYGVLRDVMHMASTAGVARGDTVAIDSAQWVLATAVSQQVLLFKAA